MLERNEFIQPDSIKVRACAARPVFLRPRLARSLRGARASRRHAAHGRGPPSQHLDSMLAALTHPRTEGSVAIRQNVLRPLPALLQRCGGKLRSSLDQVVPCIAERLVDADAGVRAPPARGSRVVITLKDDAREYGDSERVKKVIQKYSNFVNFPIRVNGEVANSVRALWTMDKSELDDEQYNEFYRFISGNAHDTPLQRLHFKADAPLDIKALLFVPSFHNEKFGMARLEPGVALYSRKVLIEAAPEDLLPSWLRFVRGVIDSEDVPLSVSREKAQDRALIRKLRDVVTRKLLRHLDEVLRKQPEVYRAFFKEFGVFLKEGACQDYDNMAQIAKLLLFESSALGSGELTTLDEVRNI
jgi:hypothetical protein